MKKLFLTFALMLVCSASLISCTETSIDDNDKIQETQLVDDGEIKDDDI